eukprot:gnl/TRDRNA2_/TRDRNA2_193014_c0_seq1.p1 gnl/TRDRNA2_/TRDRNA2_193014_c0~~gnl/TRDRNA2_/TRDRNA2_193014_c0_seq1.p1  ORF type:complete len:326 (+),score=19.26 gnl/TRDRNA2_/TRDRNA2_193014_c0_seq1:137-1114(+)
MATVAVQRSRSEPRRGAPASGDFGDAGALRCSLPAGPSELPLFVRSHESSKWQGVAAAVAKAVAAERAGSMSSSPKRRPRSSGGVARSAASHDKKAWNDGTSALSANKLRPRSAPAKRSNLAISQTCTSGHLWRQDEAAEHARQERWLALERNRKNEASEQAFQTDGMYDGSLFGRSAKVPGDPLGPPPTRGCDRRKLRVHSEQSSATRRPSSAGAFRLRPGSYPETLRNCYGHKFSSCTNFAARNCGDTDARPRGRCSAPDAHDVRFSVANGEPAAVASCDIKGDGVQRDGRVSRQEQQRTTRQFGAPVNAYVVLQSYSATRLP